MRAGGSKKLQLLDTTDGTSTIDDLFIDDYHVLEPTNNHVDLAVLFAPPSASPAAAAGAGPAAAAEPVLVLHIKSASTQPSSCVTPSASLR